MKPELYECTLRAVENSAKRIGAIPCCIALSAADIGTCELETGETVYITWGRNLNRKDQKWFFENSHFKPIWTGYGGHTELILPDESVKPMVNILN